MNGVLNANRVEQINVFPDVQSSTSNRLDCLINTDTLIRKSTAKIIFIMDSCECIYLVVNHPLVHAKGKKEALPSYDQDLSIVGDVEVREFGEKKK